MYGPIQYPDVCQISVCSSILGGDVPRWAYLAWTGLWNMVYINAQIYVCSSTKSANLVFFTDRILNSQS